MLGRLYESTRLSRLLQHLSETLDCVGLIRCYGVMEQFCARFRRMVTVYLEAFNMFVYCFAIGRLISTICALLIIVLTVAIIVVPAHDDPGSAAMAGLSLLSAFTVPFATVVVFLGGFWNAMGEASFQRALEYTELPLEKEVLSKRKDSVGHAKEGRIADDTLKGISFAAEAGQKLAVVGRTGAGKSSLVLALLRMIQRTSGVITIDGIDINTVPLKRLRTAISVIPQDYSMFTGTLRENLDPQGTHSDEVLWRVLRSVHLSDFVEKSPEGLSFCVSQKGENLSAGQRQLVALARALLRATRILVLDEATSQMDSDTERKVQASLRDSFSDCTVITIAHRIDSILDYDRVVVMGDGRVLETGGVRELLSNPCSMFRGDVRWYLRCPRYVSMAAHPDRWLVDNVEPTALFRIDHHVRILRRDEGLICSFCVSLSVRCQIRAQLLMQMAVFKKVTCLSAAGVAANPSGYVSSLLAADIWALGLFISFLANAFVGLLCVPLVLATLAYEMGYEPACACLAWILLVAVACAVIEPLLYKSCRVLYRFRDERLKKFTDFLLSIRPIKMSALEGVFQKSLLHLREKEINQAYRVNILEMLLETLFTASSTMVRKIKYQA
ncbi:hypothetical protein MTO96_007887 [Rhipicephalus appendiculatus]